MRDPSISSGPGTLTPKMKRAPIVTMKMSLPIVHRPFSFPAGNTSCNEGDSRHRHTLPVTLQYCVDSLDYLHLVRYGGGH